MFQGVAERSSATQKFNFKCFSHSCSLYLLFLDFFISDFLTDVLLREDRTNGQHYISNIWTDLGDWSEYALCDSLHFQINPKVQVNIILL